MRAGDLARWARVSLSTPDAFDRLAREICDRFGVAHSVPTSTGRAGMTVLLRAMRRLAPAERDEVVVPSYTCYSVAASIVKAGLRPRLVDISPETLDYAHDELSQTDFSRVLALVATNLYGLPSDLPWLDGMARDRNIFLIDDAAQAMGGSIQGRWCGTWGDAGLFSFDKGKNVSAIDGGVIVTKSDVLAAALRREMSDLASPGAAVSVRHVAKGLAYFLMLRPWLYGIPAGIPQLGLGKTVFTTDFPLALPTRSQAALGLTMLRHLEEFTSVRIANAVALLKGLAPARMVQSITPVAGSRPVYLRLPILLASREARDAAVAALNAVGIGATGSYPRSLADVPELRPRLAGASGALVGGRLVAERIATLPTHPFVTDADIARIAATLRG